VPIFRNLFVAALLSDIGTFMQTVGAAWLTVSLGASATFVALTQTASSLPFFVFALPAGAIGDIVDRRKLILYCEFWMVGVAILLAVATIGRFMSPWLLLTLTFALSAGDAIETPTWRAVLPELVGKNDLASASRGLSGLTPFPERRRAASTAAAAATPAEAAKLKADEPGGEPCVRGRLEDRRVSRQRPDAERVDGIGTPPTPDAMGARSTPRWMYVAGIIAQQCCCSCFST
jgi:hypothetical protein